MLEPELSVIVPVYNAEKYLCQCVDSILNQKFENLELVLVDDGSNDKSSQICDDYGDQDKRVKVIHIENKGVSNARNIGIQIASGKYIAFVDADDWIDEHMYSVLIEQLVRQKAELSLCSFILHDGYTQQIVGFPWKNDCVFAEHEIPRKVIPAFLSNIDLYGNLQQHVMGSVWRCLFTKTLIKENGIHFDEEVAFTEDLIFLLHALSKSERVAFVERPFYNYRQDILKEDSMTQKYIPNAYWNLKIGLQRVCDILQELDYLDELTMQIEWKKIFIVLACILNLFKEGSPYTYQQKIEEVKGYVNDCNLRKSIRMVYPSAFTTKQRLFLIPLKYSLVGVAIACYTIIHASNKLKHNFRHRLGS